MVELNFVTLDVFTKERYRGNQLAIVHVPSSTTLTQEQKQTVTREFNLSETVFLHEPASEEAVAKNEVKIDIFTIQQELPFAGHPTVGSSFYVLKKATSQSNVEDAATGALLTLAGRIPASYDPKTQYARIEVPHAITIHDFTVPIPLVARLIGLPSTAGPEAIIPTDASGTGAALVSVVKGLAFIFVRVASLEVLGSLSNSGVKPSAELLGFKDEDNTFFATYVYTVLEESEGLLRTRNRMFEGNFEDAATGSAASCLAGFLSIVGGGKNGEFTKYDITQGVEMGRKSDISVEVQTKSASGADGKEVTVVDKIWLSGSAVEVQRGTITV